MNGPLWIMVFIWVACFLAVTCAFVRHEMLRAPRHPQEMEDAKYAERPHLPKPLIKQKSFKDRLDARRRREATLTPSQREFTEARRKDRKHA